MRSGKTLYSYEETQKALKAGLHPIGIYGANGLSIVHNEEELNQYYGLDLGSEDIIVITHTVACCRCGKANVVTLQRGDDIVYLDDILIADNWQKDQYGRWFCDECSYPGGDD